MAHIPVSLKHSPPALCTCRYIGLRAGDPDLTFARLPKRLGERSARALSATAEAAAAEQPGGLSQAGHQVSVSGVAQAHSSPPAKDAAIPGIGRPTSARASSPPEPPAAAAGKASGETAPGLQPSSLGPAAPSAVSGQVPGEAAASSQQQPPAAGTMPLDLAASLQQLPGILASLERLSGLSPDHAEPRGAAVLHPPSGQAAQGSLHAAKPASLLQTGSTADELPPRPDAGAVLSQAAAALSAAQNAGLAGADLGLPTQEAGEEGAVVVDVAALSHEALMAMSAASATNPCRALLERQPGVQASRQAFVTGGMHLNSVLGVSGLLMGAHRWQCCQSVPSQAQMAVCLSDLQLGTPGNGMLGSKSLPSAICGAIVSWPRRF